MKIAISATGKDTDSLLDMRFARCDYFQIYDSESEEFKVIENKGQLSGGGAGIAASQQLVDENVNIIITGSLGPNAFKIIEKAEIKY
jgi:predicted Fe-Mo cluster-binding NifX family protein